MYTISLMQKNNPAGSEEKKALKVDLSPLFFPRELPMPNREAVSLLRVEKRCCSATTVQDDLCPVSSGWCSCVGVGGAYCVHRCGWCLLCT